MRFKVAPEPRSLAFVREASAALPLVPGSEDDCCARVVEATDVGSREVAREWITFLRALGLVEETGSGYRRLLDAADDAALARAFRERVFAAGTVLDALETDGPRDVDGVFEHVRGTVPTWERNRSPGWRSDWRERVRRLLEWAVVFGLAERVDAGYRAV
ncbi:hypothetical protein [Halococcus hamelinensis]|uniref:Uncharacterized protein n=1 Tax=Halococcus hamelinensis 100A6 TaxID=1132509 RepID=M0MA84_9EURY|nr:hypothetical protein [Halococcus hamelinensis]EMA41514.1 hypothetical protein C447_01630 [Halococcus hamelinensis 100A6]